MKNLRFTIGNKILLGFLGLIIVFAINAATSVIIGINNNSTIKNSSEVVNPSVSALKDFKLLVIRSKMLVTNWVYLPNNDEDKADLKNLHGFEYPELRERLGKLMTSWEKEDIQLMDSIYTDFDALIEVQKEIMSDLVSFEDYEDAMIKFGAEESIEGSVLPMSNSLITKIDKISGVKEKEAREAEASIISRSERLSNTTIILTVIITIIGLIGGFFMARSITRPINYIKEVIVELGKGILPKDNNRRFGNDEIGEMAIAVDNLVEGLKSTSYFAENIGKGNYDSDYKPLSEEDVLGNALIDMRDNLKKVAEEDKRRSWATEGMALFGEILRKNTDNLSKLSDDIMSNLVKYLKANQGGLYIVQNTEGDEPYMEMTACYAWDKKKYLEQKVFEGEGLTGQSWLERDTIYMTEIPDDYIKITSGLGEANPSSILIVPLKVNEEVYGVIEIASFNNFQRFEIDFVEKIAESIASTISSVKINETTQKLLEESQELTEQMRAQEEEMRQNMEELQATQEEMQRGQRDREDKERIISQTSMVLELDSQFNVISSNDLVKQKLKFDESDLKGRSFEFVVGSTSDFEMLQSAADSSRPWSGVIKLKTKTGETMNAHIAVGKAHDKEMGREKYLVFAVDIS